MKADKWIEHVLELERQNSLQMIPDHLKIKLAAIPKKTIQMMSWKQIGFAAAGLALLIALNITVITINDSNQNQPTKEFEESYFSHLTILE